MDAEEIKRLRALWKDVTEPRRDDESFEQYTDRALRAEAQLGRKRAILVLLDEVERLRDEVNRWSTLSKWQDDLLFYYVDLYGSPEGKSNLANMLYDGLTEARKAIGMRACAARSTFVIYDEVKGHDR